MKTMLTFFFVVAPLLHRCCMLHRDQSGAAAGQRPRVRGPGIVFVECGHGVGDGDVGARGQRVLRPLRPFVPRTVRLAFGRPASSIHGRGKQHERDHRRVERRTLDHERQPVRPRPERGAPREMRYV